MHRMHFEADCREDERAPEETFRDYLKVRGEGASVRGCSREAILAAGYRVCSPKGFSTDNVE